LSAESEKDAERRRETIAHDRNGPGDKNSRFCLLDEEGAVVEEGSVAITKQAMLRSFGARPRCRIAMEVGTHSPWVSRLLSRLGHEVIVANARQVQLISKSSSKDDRMDARTLARLARFDPQLLRPIRHRSEEAQQDLMAIRVRAAAVDGSSQTGQRSAELGEVGG
jgi:transposase